MKKKQSGQRVVLRHCFRQVHDNGVKLIEKKHGFHLL